MIFDFVRESVCEYRAHHYMLVLSGHGDGILGNFLVTAEADARANLSVVSLAELVQRVKNGPLGGEPLDILGLDSCLMGMTEVAYAVHNTRRS